MSNIQVFNNGNFTIRTINDDGKIWFVAKDVAEALDYSEASLNQVNNLFAAVPDIWTAHKRIMVTSDKPTARPYQDVLCLSEQGLYFFLGRSDKPKALPYQMWIAGEVVPSIRETGNYITRPENTPISRSELDSASLILERAGIKDNQLTLSLDMIYKKRTGYSALQAAEIQLIAPVKEQIVTPTQIGEPFGLSARKVNNILAGAGYQHKIAGEWEPIGDGFKYANPNGTLALSMSLKT